MSLLRKILSSLSMTETDNRENVITTHSPSLTTQFDDEAIIMLSADENGNAEAAI